MIQQLQEVTPVSLVLASIPKSRPVSEQELVAKYSKLCERNNVLPLWGQIRTALKRLLGVGKIEFIETPRGRLVRKI